MNFLKSFALVSGITFAAISSSAQTTNQTTSAPSQQPTRPTPEVIAQKQTDRVKQFVTGITPDQEKQILSTELEFTKNSQAAWTSSNGDKSVMHSKLQPLKDVRDAKLKTILTTDQYTQYQKTLPPSSRKEN